MNGAPLPSDTIRIIRTKLGMTQEEFAHELGITVGTVSRWENGRFRPSKLALSSLSSLLSRNGLSGCDPSPALTPVPRGVHL